MIICSACSTFKLFYCTQFKCDGEFIQLSIAYSDLMFFLTQGCSIAYLEAVLVFVSVSKSSTVTVYHRFHAIMNSSFRTPVCFTQEQELKLLPIQEIFFNSDYNNFS